MSRYLTPLFTTLAAIGFVLSLWLIFTDSPLQTSYLSERDNPQHFVLSGSSLFFNQKIVYFHVSHAFWLFTAVGVSGLASIAFLWKRNPKWDDIALASAEIAVGFGAVVLLTGSIWAKAAWDVWWKWENRLTMSLLLWLTLVGYVLVRRFAGASGERIAAGMAIFAMIGVPFIYVMVGAGDNHPQAGPDGTVATFEHDMLLPFWTSVATFLFWYLALVSSRVTSVRMEREVRELREQALDAGVIA
jgi:heme exporter protein C